MHKIRLNPGNISDRAQVRDVIQACKARKLPIRVGVNEGSIVERRDKQRRLKELGGVFSNNKHGHLLAIMPHKSHVNLQVFNGAVLADRFPQYAVLLAPKAHDAQAHDPYQRPFYRRFRALVDWCLHRRCSSSCCCCRSWATMRS